MKKLFIILCVLLIGGLCVGGWLYDRYSLHEINESIMWQKTGDSNTRMYHIKGEIATGSGIQVIAMKVGSIEGVQAIIPFNYCIGVTKSCLYSWDEVDSRIAGIVDSASKDVQSLKDYLQSPQAPEVPKNDA